MALRPREVNTYNAEQGKLAHPCWYLSKHTELHDWTDYCVKAEKPFEELAAEAFHLIADSTERGYLSADAADMLVKQVCIQTLEWRLTIYVSHYLTPLWKVPVPTVDASAIAHHYAPFRQFMVPPKPRAVANAE